MMTLKKVAEHVSHAFCALTVGIWLGAAFEVVDGRDVLRHEQLRNDLRHLIEFTVLGGYPFQ